MMIYLTQELTPQGAVSYSYDAIGRRTSMTANGLAPVNYQYDLASRLTQVAQGPQAVNLGYDASGRRTSLTYPNGTGTNYFYDNASRLNEILHQGPSGIIEDLTYTYDAAGNRISYDRTNPQADLPQEIQAAYDAANQMAQFNTDTLSYDANGNLTFDGTTTYTWDARNRLVQLVNAGMSAQFTYDALGHRVSKTINGATIQYLYGGNDIVAEIQNNTITATYLRSLNIDESFLRSSAVAEYYHTDALGSVLALTDQNGAVQTTYSYDPFGSTTIAGTSSNPFQYTGRENDGTGLYYYRARYYSSIQQRFLSQDPFNLASMQILRQGELDALLGNFFYKLLLKQPQQLHAYTYVQNDPLRFADPYGLVTAVFGGGFSAIARAGVEGSGGVYYDTNKSEFGGFAAVGAGAGINVSYDIFGGLIFGELTGVTANTNIVVGPASLTLMIDPISGEFIGFTFGWGPLINPIIPPFGFSETISVTATKCVLGCRK